MHDIDRTQLEGESEWGAYESEQFEMPDQEGELYGEVFNEAEQLELASELLEIGNEQELDQFLGRLIKRAGGAVRRAISSPLGQQLFGILKDNAKNAARQALPLIGGTIGTRIGGRVGPAIGNAFSSVAGAALGLEGETLSQEDREFEGAKQFVRMAGRAVANATAASPVADPRSVARNAVAAAAQILAPGLVRAGVPATSAAIGGGRSGRWIRRGSKIVLLGV